MGSKFKEPSLASSFRIALIIQSSWWFNVRQRQLLHILSANVRNLQANHNLVVVSVLVYGSFSLHDLCDRLPDVQRVSILLNYCFFVVISQTVRRVCRSVWPRGLKRTYAAAWSLGLRVRIPLRASMFVFCEYCLLSGRGLCDELITRSEEPCCVCVCVCVSNCVI